MFDYIIVGAGSAGCVLVDAECRVHGVAGPRVVDASVLPALITGHPNAIVMATAERAAERIASGHRTHV